MRTITLLVAGPIKSRLSEALTFQDLENSFKIFRLATPNGKIVISTYESEFPSSFHYLVDSVVINHDPGCDYFKPNPWPIESGGPRSSANYKRLITSTLQGLMACEEGFVIKTRVELLPRKLDDFSAWVNQIVEDFDSNSSLKIGFFLEHYSGISFSINGLLGGIPDTLQIGNRVDLLRVWGTASRFWEGGSRILTRSSKRFPLTSEQVIGLSFLQEFYGFNLDKRVRRLDRYYRSPALVRAILKSEQEAISSSSYQNSGFESDYLKKSFSLDLSRASVPRYPWDVIKKLLLVQAKMIYHHYRRYFVGLRRILAPKQ